MKNEVQNWVRSTRQARTSGAEIRPANEVLQLGLSYAVNHFHTPFSNCIGNRDHRQGHVRSWKMWQSEEVSISGVKDALRSIPRRHGCVQ